MVYKSHYIELYINGHKMDLESQNSLNLRFQNVLYNPEKISSSQAEYSFEFELPSTPNNDKIFDYANNFSKLNKFHQRWNAEVYADGTIIFTGSLTLNGFKKGMYKCNLVSVKAYSLDDIFGDAVLSDIPWEIPFDGAGDSGYTIDYYNSLSNSDVVFPFVCYGAFQKDSKFADSVARDYTSKFLLDNYNRWYIESFYPSLSLLETLKRAFEYKGKHIGGDAFKNATLKDIFMSTNLADEQSPSYNLGNPKFGKVDLTVSWLNPMDDTSTILGTSYGFSQDLKFPYFKSGDMYWDCSQPGDCIEYDPDYNFSEVRIYDMMSSGDGGSVTVTESSYMYQPNEHLIVIPADGFYKIHLAYSGSLRTTSALTAAQLVHTWNDNIGVMSSSVEEKDITFNSDFRITTPLEIQLVRNYEDNLELIKGAYNIKFKDGYPDHTQICDRSDQGTNYQNFITCYPHEPLGGDVLVYGITKNNDLEAKYTNNIGYIPAYGETMAYDPAVSPIFLVGATSMGNKHGYGTNAVLKNGYSWSKSYADKNNGFYNQPGYFDLTRLDYQGATTSARTEYNLNECNGAKNSFMEFSRAGIFTNGSMVGTVECILELKKNDVLQLFGVHREYTKKDGTPVTYQTQATVNLTIEAYSPRTYEDLKKKPVNYLDNSEFPYNLQVNNFLNKEKKISEWVQNVADAFNLDILQNGDNVELNVKKKFNRSFNTAVDIDDRVNTADAESSKINYPKSMSVRYKIDTDEWGFEKSVTPPEALNYPNWKDYGDSGFTVIELNDDEYETSKSDKNLQFSYTWYDNFTWLPINSSFDPDTGDRGDPQTLTIPVISKYQYMIDGYDYEESMKHDGYGLAQRFWFRPTKPSLTEQTYVWTRTYPAEKINIYVPHNQKDGVNLSYKTTEPSLLRDYFNITPYLASNYVTVEVYLSPEEYKLIKNGSMVRFDSDLYYPVEITGYDPTGSNPTEIKMIKKI